MATTAKEQKGIRNELKDIIVDISWAKVAKRYFDRSPYWMYHKIDGIDNNGKRGGFTEDELSQFKSALYDLSARIEKAADDI